MNQNPSSNGTPKPSERAGIEPEPDRKPPLQQDPTYLDINLEDELIRFRDKQEHRVRDLQPMQVSEETWEQESVGDELDAEIITAEIVKPVISGTLIDEDELTVPAGEFVVLNELTPDLQRAELNTLSYAPLTVHAEDISVPYQSLDVNFSAAGEIEPFHHEYSASSQELLRQIQSGATTTPDSFNTPIPVVTTTKRKIFTPIKLGAIAAACVIAGGAVYTYCNPSILAPLTATKVEPIVATTSNSLGQIIQSPNLAANEFTELNLSTLNTVAMPTTATSPSVNIAMNPAVSGTVTTAPVAVPFNPVNPQSILAPAATTTGVQPRLADSLIKSLLPPNFRVYAKQTQRPAVQPVFRNQGIGNRNPGLAPRN
jgi:hypothetical protein